MMSKLVKKIFLDDDKNFIIRDYQQLYINILKKNNKKLLKNPWICFFTPISLF